ncbi:MAG: cytochrome c oxidase assembly protein, partial [Chloroflexota bacterium]
ASIPNVLLGAFLTFSPVLYPFYARTFQAGGLGDTIRSWGLSALTDQQAGGLLMWVGGGFVYLAFILSIFLGWTSRMDVEEERAGARCYQAGPAGRMRV